MAFSRIKCDESASGNVAAFVVKSAPARSVQALQRGGSHPTSNPSLVVEKRLTV